MAATARSSSTWILIRGLAREQGHWGAFRDQFAASLPKGDDVLAIDLPGTGEHYQESSPMTMSSIFNHVRGEAIARTREQNQFKILAVSMGAMVAMEWLKQKPQDLSGCVLINSSSRSLSPAYRRLRWQIWGDFVKLAGEQNLRERERGILDLLLNNPEARAEALPLWAKIATERPVSYPNFFRQLTASATFGGLEKAPDVPTLLLNGLGDRFVDPSCSTQLHERYGWPIFRHPWAGHDTTWDDPQWVIDKIKLWATSANA